MSFKFPRAEYAYETCKPNVFQIIYLFVAGFFISMAGGLFLLSHIIFFWFFLLICCLPGVFTEFFCILLSVLASSSASSLLSAWIIRLPLCYCNEVIKCNSKTLFIFVAIFSGALSVIFSAFLRYLLLGYPNETFPLWAWIIQIGISLLCLPFLIIIFGLDTLRPFPFCKICHKYMDNISLGRYPLTVENKLMEFLINRMFLQLRTLEPDFSLKEYTEVELWHCKNCLESGFIDAKTNIIEFEDEKKQIIFSTAINTSEVTSLLNEKL